MAVNNSVESLVDEIKKYLIPNPTLVVGPIYQDMNLQLADIYLGAKKEELKGIYHLTEAHGATLRQQTVIRYDYKEDHITSKKAANSTIPIAQGLKKDFLDFVSVYAKQEENGLLTRLKEMPTEWTVVQITRERTPQEYFKVRSKDLPPTPSKLYITRLPCGDALKERSPVQLLIEMPEKIHGMPTIFELMKQAKEGLRKRHGSTKEIRKERENASQSIKEVVDVLSKNVLKQWKCLLLGTLCNASYKKQICDCIDNVVNSEEFKLYKMDRKDRELLYQVAEGVVHLNDAEIHSAVCCLVDSKELGIKLIRALKNFKDNMSILLAARRHPVILIVDDMLDDIPWEMLPVFRKHPVSRMPSIHFLHALYHEHKDHIVGGCRVVNDLDMGFYIVNPDADLELMESRLMKFIRHRMPRWSGVAGKSPTEEEFCSALIQNNVLLYCGHFNGSHYLRPDDISNLKVVALPLLFGCSSVALQDLGGRARPTGVSDKYLMAGCACVIGMLWTVMSDDADCMTACLLNSWLPGDPVDLKSFRSSGDMLAAPKDPELLRLMRYARDTAVAYSNAAAMVARGIPVKFVPHEW